MVCGGGGKEEVGGEGGRGYVSSKAELCERGGMRGGGVGGGGKEEVCVCV